jgi:hypothetical protein
LSPEPSSRAECFARSAAALAAALCWLPPIKATVAELILPIDADLASGASWYLPPRGRKKYPRLTRDLPNKT